MPWFLGNSNGIGDALFGWGIGLPFLLLWTLVWSGLALWHAAKRGEKWWFVVFLCVHTLGILEIIYLAFVVKLFSEEKQSSPPRMLAKRKRRR